MIPNKKNRDEFANIIAWLVSCYTKLYGIDADVRAKNWFDEFRRFDVEVIREGATVASREHPDTFPTRGQLERACLVVLAARKEKERARERQLRDEREDYEHAREVALLPEDEEDQDDWVQWKCITPCEKLRRWFLVLSRRSGCRPSYVHPTKTGVSRLRLLFDAFCEQVEMAERRRAG